MIFQHTLLFSIINESLINEEMNFIADPYDFIQQYFIISL